MMWPREEAPGLVHICFTSSTKALSFFFFLLSYFTSRLSNPDLIGFQLLKLNSPLIHIFHCPPFFCFPLKFLGMLLLIWGASERVLRSGPHHPGCDFRAAALITSPPKKEKKMRVKRGARSTHALRLCPECAFKLKTSPWPSMVSAVFY